MLKLAVNRGYIMKISKISAIVLSGLLVTQVTMPMENPANTAFRKAQKAGKLALKIGTGAATLGVYTLLGTAALASWGITVGAAAMSLARFLAPKPSKNLKVAPETSPRANTISKSSIKRPQMAPKINVEKNALGARMARYSHSVKTASMVGLAAIENDMLDPQMLKESRMNREQLQEIRHQQALELLVELKKCNEQSIQWNKDYTRTYHAELPRFEGPYQDMIGIYDADLEDMLNEAHMQMKVQIDQSWERAGCKESTSNMQKLARRIEQEHMRLPKNI